MLHGGCTVAPFDVPQLVTPVCSAPCFMTAWWDRGEPDLRIAALLQACSFERHLHGELECASVARPGIFECVICICCVCMGVFGVL